EALPLRTHRGEPRLVAVDQARSGIESRARGPLAEALTSQKLGGAVGDEDGVARAVDADRQNHAGLQPVRSRKDLVAKADAVNIGADVTGDPAGPAPSECGGKRVGPLWSGHGSGQVGF